MPGVAATSAAVKAVATRRVFIAFSFLSLRLVHNARWPSMFPELTREPRMIFLLAGTTSCNRAFGWCFAASGGRYVLQSRTTINHERCISPRVEDIVGGGAHHRAEHRSHSDDADGRSLMLRTPANAMSCASQPRPSTEWRTKSVMILRA